MREQLIDMIINLLFIICLALLLFILTHLRPLNDKEINDLATKRRKKDIRQYFNFSRQELSPDLTFKREMNPKGEFYNVSEELYLFPSVVASLLKYKKHEWVIIGFEKDRKIDLLWLNKGKDNLSVRSLLDADDICKIAIDRQYKSVLKFHNHPNSNPNYYDCSEPSEQDLYNADYLAKKLNKAGINLITFVCERGMHYEYGFYPADTFLPLNDYLKEISTVNGCSIFKNLQLHFERVF